MAWQGIEGHDRVVARLRQALERGRLGHAYLFAGPPGVGKRRFALALAQALLCEERAEAELDPCQQCPACRQARAATHPDLILVSREADEHELPIERVREAISQLGLKPDRGRRRVAIIDDADQMNQYAANCLLKSLEEPPPFSLLILIGVRPDRQLPTIRSRCQVLQFEPLTAEQVAMVLVREGLVADEQEARRLAATSRGSVERARGLADPALAQFRSELARRLNRPREEGPELAERISRLVEAAGASSAEKRLRARLLISMASDFLHACLRYRLTGQLAGDQAQTDVQAVAEFAARHHPEKIANLMERSLTADYQIERKAYLPLVIEGWADDLLRCLL